MRAAALRVRDARRDKKVYQWWRAGAILILHYKPLPTNEFRGGRGRNFKQRRAGTGGW